MSNARRKIVVPLIVVGIVLMTSLAALRVTGLIIPFSVPTGGMAPAISPRDHVLMEGFSFLARKPRRGDIVVFKTDGIESLESGNVYLKRVVGEPGDQLRIVAGKLYVNEKPVDMKNRLGEIHYVFLPFSRFLTSTNDTATVPDGSFFVLGDNSTNSADSRIWGCLPSKNVKGRILFCYWPLGRFGGVP